MRVFVTGATGYIGNTVAKALRTGGHQVLGLARSNFAAQRLEAEGINVHRGDLGDLHSIKFGAAATDAVIHAAFSPHEWGWLNLAFEHEKTAVEAMIDEIKGTGKPFVYTSGSGVFANTKDTFVDEKTATSAKGDMALRATIEHTVLSASKHGVRSIVIRPGLVYGNGGGHLVRVMGRLTHKAGRPLTVGHGRNVWSTVHVEDLAELYLKVLEIGTATGIYHAASEENPSMRDIAFAIARSLNLESSPIAWPQAIAKQEIGRLAKELASDKRLSAARARKDLGWNPQGISLQEDIENGSYPVAFAADSCCVGLTRKAAP